MPLPDPSDVRSLLDCRLMVGQLVQLAETSLVAREVLRLVAARKVPGYDAAHAVDAREALGKLPALPARKGMT